jgi:glycogen operon protein
VVAPNGEVNERGLPDIVWHGTQLNKPGCNDANARCLAFTLGGFDGAPDRVWGLHRF